MASVTTAIRAHQFPTLQRTTMETGTAMVTLTTKIATVTFFVEMPSQMILASGWIQTEIISVITQIPMTMGMACLMSMMHSH